MLLSGTSVPIEQYLAVVAELKQSRQENKELKVKITVLEEEVIFLKEQLLLMQHRIFGKKSEAHEPGEPPVDPSADPATNQTITVASHTRKKKTKTNGRLIDTSTLRRHKIYHDLDNKTCPCCNGELERIGEDISEQLEIIPMIFYVIEHIRYKYTCRKCQTIIMSPKALAPIPKALAGGSLLTEIIINKYQYHLPLYRQSKIFASHNMLIPDNTLGNWVMQSGAALMAELSAALWQAVLGVRYLQVDETPIKILITNKKGYLWTFLAPYVGSAQGLGQGRGLVVFELSLTRSGSVADEKLAKFKGILQTDGYGGYNNTRRRKDIASMGCLTHARRKFNEVFKITKKNPNGIAAEFMRRVKPLYELEEKMRELKVSFHTRKRWRQKQAWPVLKALRPWLKQQLLKVPGKSKLAKAIKYTLNQWRYIIAYLRHGMAEIDTNWVENKIRPEALGRKNWLFMDNADSGAVNAFWFSLVSSAILNGLNPKTYIHYLLMKVHDIRKGIINPITVLPHTIDKALLQEFENEQIAMGKKVLDSS
jgi:transposase